MRLLLLLIGSAPLCFGVACAQSESGIGRVGGRYPMDTLTELQTVLIKS